MEIKYKYENVEVPEGLAKLANGRDIITLAELSFVTNIAQQTIRKHLCLSGSCFGITPLKIGGRLQFKVSEVAKLLTQG